MSREALFITGASGFVGRHVVVAAARRYSRVVALSRRELADLPAPVESMHGDLLGDPGWESALVGCDAVIHLAAPTGKASPRAYERGIVDATARVLAAARRAQVRHFVYVSSIAVRFTDQAHYPYARKKAAAEGLVRASGLGATIVRPAIVAGPGSPVMKGFEMLARGPLTPVFGDGRKRVAPIHVRDLAELLVEIAAGDPASEPVELGGPAEYSIDALLGAIRAASRASPPRLIHLPLAPIRAPLAWLEPALRPLLPITAGQLATFANDGLPARGAFAASHADGLRSIFATETEPPLPRLVEPAATLRAECEVFARRLLGASPSAALRERYVRQQRALALDSPSGFDALLVRLARRGGVALALADAYAGWILRRSVLRAKLVGVLALLETSRESFAALDAPDASAPWPRLVLRGLAEIFTAAAAVLVLGPLHLLSGRR